MSYTVLARKYRPRNFSEMVGQSHVVQALSNALLTQRLHHAYLFTGTRGVGKTTVSRILAKSLNCTGSDGQGGVTAEPCGVCDACREIDAGRFVDYTELDAASNRGVDEVQSLLEQAVYKPVQGRYKVFMIDEVHMLTNTAFNAMLKTLEEPPEYLKFVLATTDPQKVPVTVLSRCLQFNLRPMPPQTVADHLAQVLDQEAVVFESSALTHLSVAARGSMRDALSLTDQAIAYGQGELREDTVRAMLGVADQQHVIEVLQALARGDGAAVVAAVDHMRLQGQAAAAMLEAMAAMLQRMAICQMTHIAPDADVAHAAQIHELAQQMPADETQLLYSMCLTGRAELGLAVDEYAGLVMVLLRLLAFKPQAWGQAASAEKKTLKTPEPSSLAIETASRPPGTLQRSLSSPGLAQTASGTEELAPADGSAAQMPPPIEPLGEPFESSASLETAVHDPASATSSDAPNPRRDDIAPWEDPPEQAQGAAEMADVPVTSAGAERAPLAQVPGPAVVDDRAAAGASDGSGSPRVAITRLSALDALASEGVREMSTRLDQPADGMAQREPEVDFTAEGDFWAAVVDELLQRQSIAALARELALQSQMVARDAQAQTEHWLLRVESASLNQAGALERLRLALQDVGHSVELAVEVGRVSDTPGRRIAAVKQRRLKEAEALLRNDAALAPVFASFGGTIVPGTLRPKDLGAP